MTTISTTELRSRLHDPGLTIVDVRPLAAFNGWRLDGEIRGGHIPGARAFPAAWLSTVDAAEIDRLLDAKGIVAGREIVVYGSAADDAAAMAVRFRDLGFGATRVLDGGADAWAADRSCRSTAFRSTRNSCISTGFATSSRAGDQRPRHRADSSCSMSISGFRRNTPKVTSRERTTSTPTGSRIRPTGTGARRSRSRPPPRARYHARHDGRRLRPRHGGSPGREVARPPRRPDRGDARADDPALRRGR